MNYNVNCLLVLADESSTKTIIRLFYHVLSEATHTKKSLVFSGGGAKRVGKPEDTRDILDVAVCFAKQYDNSNFDRSNIRELVRLVDKSGAATHAREIIDEFENHPDWAEEDRKRLECVVKERSET